MGNAVQMYRYDIVPDMLDNIVCVIAAVLSLYHDIVLNANSERSSITSSCFGVDDVDNDGGGEGGERHSRFHLPFLKSEVFGLYSYIAKLSLSPSSAGLASIILLALYYMSQS